MEPEPVRSLLLVHLRFLLRRVKMSRMAPARNFVAEAARDQLPKQCSNAQCGLMLTHKTVCGKGWMCEPNCACCIESLESRFGEGLVEWTRLPLLTFDGAFVDFLWRKRLNRSRFVLAVESCPRFSSLLVFSRAPQIKAHEEEECPWRKGVCRFHLIGCDWTGLAVDQGKHEAGMPQRVYLTDWC